MISNNEYEINICVPADDVERPKNPMPTPDDIIFDFNKINITLARKYVHIIINGYNLDEYKFNIENEEDAHRIIKDFIIHQEECPELVFQVGVCEKSSCIDLCNPNHYCAPDTCPHRLVSFEYQEEYTYIEVYGGTLYKIRIVL
jgi:hypothetical protein